MSQAITNHSLNDIYARELGRAPDAGGAAFWSNQISSGAMTIDQVTEAIRNSAEAQGR